MQVVISNSKNDVESGSAQAQTFRRAVGLDCPHGVMELLPRNSQPVKPRGLPRVFESELLGQFGRFRPALLVDQNRERDRQRRWVTFQIDGFRNWVHRASAGRSLRKRRPDHYERLK